jgi:DNA-directed RNA polymerase subunit RPC12/RpoP
LAEAVCQRCYALVQQPQGSEQRCSSCGAHVLLTVFPSLYKPPEKAKAGETLLVGEQSSCYYHPSKAAVLACDSCGRFLCALCDIELGEQHVCAACLASSETELQERLERGRSLPDNVSLDLSIFPLFLCTPLIVFTAPMVLFLCVRYWRADISLVPRLQWRLPVALLLGGLQVVLMLTFIFFVIIGAFAS